MHIIGRLDLKHNFSKIVNVEEHNSIELKLYILIKSISLKLEIYTEFFLYDCNYILRLIKLPSPSFSLVSFESSQM